MLPKYKSTLAIYNSKLLLQIIISKYLYSNI